MRKPRGRRKDEKKCSDQTIAIEEKSGPKTGTGGNNNETEKPRIGNTGDGNANIRKKVARRKRQTEGYTRVMKLGRKEKTNGNARRNHHNRRINGY